LGSLRFLENENHLGSLRFMENYNYLIPMIP